MGRIFDPEKPNTIYIQPAPRRREVRYIEGIEEAGLIVDEKHAIAMYTARSVPNVGPQGPPGHGFDCVIASCSDEHSPLTVDLVVPKTTFRAPYAMDLTNGHVRISVTTAPVGGPLIVDLKMNGTSVFSTKVQIDAGATTSVGSSVPAVLSTLSVPDDAEFKPYVTAVGSSVAGTGLKIAVVGEKV
jgi:hypothetical protein